MLNFGRVYSKFWNRLSTSSSIQRFTHALDIALALHFTSSPFTNSSIWMFPKIVGFHPKSSILIGFSIIFTIHFGGKVPLYFLVQHPLCTCQRAVFERNIYGPNCRQKVEQLYNIQYLDPPKSGCQMDGKRVPLNNPLKVQTPPRKEGCWVQYIYHLTENIRLVI